ncbi:MAG: decarboxylating NADP(+)-dependent phosphogluconate dehydrogenase [Planctomycetota bacterium]
MSKNDSKGTQQADLGLIGLAVMGENLVLNMEDHGFTVAVFNRTVSKVDDFVNRDDVKGRKIIGTKSVEELVKSLKRPRRVMLMVKAGTAVDDFIELVIPHLEKGDIIIDGGNSNYNDSIRRTAYIESKGLLFIGTGVSGGEEGARFGPSIMPGGSKKAWPAVKKIFQSISAKVSDGTPCCDWVGENGAGHYVKMVHNGIEYGDMQLICEAYQIMSAMGLTNDELYETFADWNKGKLDSYLIEITRDIFKAKDNLPGKKGYLVDKILDTAGQKGTGKWTGISALDLGIPVTLVVESVFARCLSAIKDERVSAAKQLKGPKPSLKVKGKGKADLIDAIRDALYASKICSYAQGFQLMREAAKEYKWKLNFGEIALMWRGGCIIRAQFLGKIKEAFDKNPELVNLMLDPYFKKILTNAQKAWRKVISICVDNGIPAPVFMSAIAYYDSYRSARLPANLLQAQRDYFGAHTYERLDKPRGEWFHADWIGLTRGCCCDCDCGCK